MIFVSEFMQKIDREYLRDCSTRSSQTPDDALSLQTAPAVLLPPHEKPVVRGSDAGLLCAEGAGRALAAPRRGVLLSTDKGDPDLTRDV